MSDRLQQILNQDQLLADLDWAINSPPMMAFDNSQRFRFNTSEDWYQQLRLSPEPLQAIIRQTNTHMLGPYFEGLWLAFFTCHPRYQLVAKNVQVHDKERTIGEFDFIVRDLITHESIHLEVAVKYYLGYSENIDYQQAFEYSPQSAWIGPGCNDRLDKKSKVMVERQSRLSATEAGRKALNRVGVDAINASNTIIAIRGFLFYPAEAIMSPPESAFDSHLKGRWGRAKNWQNDSSLFSAARILSKPWWLADTRVVTDVQPLIKNAGETFNRVSNCSSNLISRISASGPVLLRLNDGQKYFLVGESWPDLPQTESPA